MAEYKILDTTLQDIADMIRKKDGTQALIDPADYDDRINLMGMLEEKTASGAIASFSDGADDVPISDCKFSFSPKQASGTPSPSNPLAISGWSGLNIIHGKKNLIDTSASAWESGTINSSGQNASGSGSRTIGYYDIKGGSTFTLSGITAPSQNSDFRVFFYDESKTFISYQGYRTEFTVPSNACFFRVRNISVDDISSLQFEYGSTATAYSAYATTETKSVTWTEQGTIYGGSIDNSGLLTDAYVKINLGELPCTRLSTSVSGKYRFQLTTENLYAPSTSVATVGKCNVAVPISADYLYGAHDGIAIRNSTTIHMYDENYATDTALNFRAHLQEIGAYAVLPLRTSAQTTYQLSPLNLATYYGDNNFWSEGDTAEVQYRGSGATTIITPTLVSKTITENGTYSAEDDNADGYDEVTVNVAGTAVRIPTVLFVQSKNRGSANTFTYTFTEAGTFQYLVSMSGNSTPTTANLTVSLNNTALTPSSFSNGDLGFFYGEITVAADDVLTVTTTADSNRGAQVFVFKDADVTNFSLVAWRGNDGGTFAIQTNANVPFLEVYKTGYYESRNNFNYVIAMLSSNSAGMESTPTPSNNSNYYYGFTYVITI